MAISPHTAPGTLVVSRWEKGKGSNIPAYKGALPEYGKIYTVRDIGQCPFTKEFGCTLDEIEVVINPTINRPYQFDLKLFDYAVLPKCLTEILEKAPNLKLVEVD